MAEKARNIIVYCPNGKEVTPELNKFAPRIKNLSGKRIGLLWNSKPNGDLFLNGVAEHLNERYQNIRIIKFWELDPGGTMHPDRKTDGALDFIAKSADMVIASTAD